MAPEQWIGLGLIAFALLMAVADWWSQAGRDLDRTLVDALDPIPPAPDWDANEAAFDAMGGRR